MVSSSQCDAEYSTCVTNASLSHNPILYYSSYNRASSQLMFAVWAAYAGTLFWFTLLFLVNRKVQPVKSRNPTMVLISALGGFFLATNYAFANYVSDIHLWPCPYSHWALWLAFPMFLLPYPIRALSLFLVFNRNVNKVRDHRIEAEQDKMRQSKIIRKTNMVKGTGRVAQESLEDVSKSAPTKSKWFSMKRLEGSLSHLFFILLGICFLVGLVRQFIPEFALGPECFGCMVTYNSALAQTILILIITLTLLISTLLLQRLEVKDQFRIAGELKLVCLVWIVCLVPACALSFNGLGCDYSANRGNCDGNSPPFTLFCYQNFAGQQWLIFTCAIVTFVITVLVPVWKTVTKGKKRLLNEKKNLFPKFKALESLQDCLNDEEALAVFQEFCVQSFCVELVLFYKDVENFKQILETNSLVLRMTALDIYSKYLDASGNLFVELPQEIQSTLDLILGQACLDFQETEEKFDFSVLGMVNNNIFNQAEAEVIRQMEEDVFALFKESEAAKKLFNKYQVLTATALSLQQQQLL